MGRCALDWNHDQLNLTIQVYRPGHSAPVITAPFETVYKEVAKLWKVEFDTPKPKAAPKHRRYTNQQERDAAALERHLQTEGFEPHAIAADARFCCKNNEANSSCPRAAQRQDRTTWSGSE